MAIKPVGAARTIPAPITPAEVNQYATLNAEYSRIEKERKSLRESLVERLEAGATCPTSEPYLLVLTHQERSIYGWKEICEAILDILGERLKAKAVALIAQLQADKTEVAQLNVKPNPAWGNK